MLFEIVRRYKTQIKVAGMFLSGLLVVFFAFNYSLLLIKPVVQSEGSASVTISANRDGSTDRRRVRIGFNIVRNGASKLEFVSNNMSTVVYKDVRSLRINKVSFNLEPQKSVSKISNSTNRFAPECIFNAPDNRDVFYECRDNNLYKQDSSNNPQVITNDISLIGTQQPYKNGFLSFAKAKTVDTQEATPQLSYIEGDSVRTILSDAREYIDDNGGTISTTDSSSTFAITNKSTKTFFIFMGGDIKKISSYNFSKDIGLSDVRSIQPSISKNIFFLSYSVVNKKKGLEGATENAGDAAIIQYSLAGKVAKIKETFLKKRLDVSTAFSIDDSTIYSLDLSNRLVVSSLADGGLNDVFSVYNVSASRVFNNSLYYVTEHKLYRYSPKTKSSYMVRDLGSHNINLLSAFGGELQLTGNSRNSLTTTASYSLLSTNKPSSEPFDFIPYSPNDLPLLKSDFRGNTLYFWISLRSLAYNKDSGAKYFNQSEYSIKKDIVLKRIERDGLKPTEYNVVFNPGF